MFKHLPPANTETPCFCLVRHGQTDWNAAGRIQGLEDIELNTVGRTQALQTGLYLQQWQWDRIISSPLKRAAESAEIIADHLKLAPVEIMDVFMERDYGDCSGMTAAQRKQSFPDGIIPRQETLETLQKRVLQGLQQLTLEPQARTLIVTHGGVINSLLAHISQGEIGTGKSILHNASLALFQYQQGWKILAYNLTAHLNEFNRIVESDKP
ncbi:histidine phosphatase family protein [uncultured Thiothrix sp.]|uniref:histidine phosphatase family protein n=1 Tax=uncultured Thiothrix sp. TaxID=223185 RepID=UPI002616FFD2|nr:histidine phosphatase family protein [uncultured Thiothrix sp.]